MNKSLEYIFNPQETVYDIVHIFLLSLSIFFLWVFMHFISISKQHQYISTELVWLVKYISTINTSAACFCNTFIYEAVTISSNLALLQNNKKGTENIFHAVTFSL